LPYKKVEIIGLSFDAIIGLYEEERESPQKVVIDISFEYKYKKKNFIDYMNVIECVKNCVIKEKFFLLEDALEKLNSLIKDRYKSIKSLKIAICKPSITKECKIKISS